MQIEVQVFAAARDAAGGETICVEVDQNATASDVINAIGRCLPQIESFLPSCRLAVDSCYVGSDAAIPADSEVALIPPVSGG